MHVTAVPAETLAGVQLKIQFDNSVVQVADSGVTQGTLPSGFLFSSRVDNALGIVNIIIAGAGAANVRELRVADITFNLVGVVGQPTPITLVDALASDATIQPIPVLPANGTITVVPPFATPAATAVQPTDTPAAVPTPVAAPVAAGPTPTPSPSGGGCTAPAIATGSAMAGTPDLLLLGLVIGGVLVLRRRRRS